MLFSQAIPSDLNLGIVNEKAAAVEIEIAGHDYTIQQSPAILNSVRPAGTTGAVVWKVSPLIAAWLASQPSLLWDHGILHAEAHVVELGCGISPLIGLTVSSDIASYILTDQKYVLKVMEHNLEANRAFLPQQKSGRPKARPLRSATTAQPQKLRFMSLDWEQDSAQNLLSLTNGT